MRSGWILTVGLVSATVLMGLAGCGEEVIQEHEVQQIPVVPSKAEAGRSSSSDTAALDQALANRAGSNTGNWLLHGRTYSEQRHSPLAQINTDNVADLNLAWYVDLPDPRGQEATPLVMDGVMYTTAAWSRVYALDARTGEQLWHFDPGVDRSWGVNACCDVVNRGVALWKGSVYVGTIDGRLIAIDAATGEQRWSVSTVEPGKPYSITGAPRVAKDKVFIGNGGAEFGVRGYVSAYNASSGDLLWRFHTVPGDPARGFENETMKRAAETWSGQWWKLGGGGTVWDSMAYDPDLNLLYIGVGNGSPWNPELRSAGEGDNLFLSSIVALNADTGEYVWHYQTTPGEGWDYTATQHMILADLEIDGERRQVIMQAPKNGFFYVLDRRSGEFISAQPYVTTTWANRIDPASGRPVINPQAMYWKTGEIAAVAPSWAGGHSWHPMSYHPETGLVYIPAQEMEFPYLGESELRVKKVGANLGVDTTAAEFPDDVDTVQAIKDVTRGHLSAWDPVAQREVWRVQHQGIPNGGVLSTAGNLVFQGNGAGYFSAYRATDGEKLWQFPAQTGVVAAPMTFELDGEQYVTVMAGWGGIFPLMTGPLAWNAGEPVNRSRILTFKLKGEASLPPPDNRVRTMQDMTAIELDPEVVDRGFRKYDAYCGPCHGAGAVGGGVVPDLRYSAFLPSAEGWVQVVLEGALAGNGMASFKQELTAPDVEAIRQYVIGRNQYAHDIGDTQRISR